MSRTPATTLAAFALALAAVFGAATAVGAAVGPVGYAQPDQQSHEQDGAHR